MTGTDEAIPGFPWKLETVENPAEIIGFPWRFA
jgi:hypothetical protein